MGSFLTNLAVPAEGDKVWALLTNGKTLDRKPVKVSVDRVEQTYAGSEYSLRVSDGKGSYTTTTAYCFAKKPKQVEVVDAYGAVKV
jgi:hypothetical protein